MNFVLTLAPLLFSLFPVSSIERAFTLLRNSEWAGAAAALDEAHAENPAFFGANNFHYLRGRVAENQRDWARARQEFLKIEPGNPLYELATWHAARASANLRDGASAKLSIEKLPRDFPASMKMQVARESGPPLASEIYSEIVSREARLELAKLNGDNSALWSLLNAEQTDDAALQAAHILARSARTEREQLTIADTFLAHRQFEYAMPLYEALTAASGEAANARFQIARIHYLREDYQRAIDAFSELVRNLPGTDWEKDSDYQIASCYWRLGDFRAAEKSYLRYISKYGRTGQYEGAVRNLVDVYRALGEEQKALTWIDRLLAG
ncbi:MAG: tetratricopeptide repeat protein, partial [Acidobacteria bacterium]|nr:tetratricopeptide repeat protein [Acidobacteriota bacterium]